MSTWGKLAEAIGIETEASWDSVGKQRNMQRYGTQDRRTQLSPTAYFNNRGTGSAQGGLRPPIRPDPGIARNGGPTIPQGTDRPGQGNPLMAPSRPSPLGTAPNSPQGRGQDWLSALSGEGPEDDASESADCGDGLEEESRFKRLSKKIGKEKGVRDPDAVAASIGRKKYGAKKFAAMSHGR